MTEDEIYDAIVSAITQVQNESQRDLPPLCRDTRIVSDVPGCDSLTVLEITIVLTELLEPVLAGREIPDCILRGTKAGSHPTLSEIASEVQDFVEKGKSKRRRKLQGELSEVVHDAPQEAELDPDNCFREEFPGVVLLDNTLLKEIVGPSGSEFDATNRNLLNGNDHHE
jgi:hypothetical protein